MSRLRPGTIYLLHQTSQALRSRLEHAFRGLGVTGIQYTILGLLDAHSGLSSAELSRRFFVTPQTMNQIVAGMTQRGLIARVSSLSNKRILEMTLTPAGRDLLARCELIADAVEAQALSLLPEPQLTQMRATLRLLLQQLRTSAQAPVEELRAPGAPGQGLSAPIPARPAPRRLARARGTSG